MYLLQHINWAYSVAGFAVAVIVGLTGVGGGSMMTPLLVLAFHIQPARAVGTDLLFACITKMVGTGVHGAGKTVDWRIVGTLSLGSLPAAALTLFILSHYVHRWDESHNPLTTALGIALILTAIAMLFRKWILKTYAHKVGEIGPRRTTFFTILLGVVLGVFVSLSSVGAGAIGMTVLLMLYPKLPTARLVGTDIAHAVPLTLAAGIGHWLMGSIDWALLVSLLAGSIPGIIVGSFIATRISDRYLRPMLAGVLGFVGIKLAF